MSRRIFRILALAIPGFVIAGQIPAASAAAPAAPGASCEKLMGLTLPNVTITSAGHVPANGFIAPGQQAPMTLPTFCRVQAIASPSADSEIHFEVWIPPMDAWNGKFQGEGVGGYDGSISYGAMATGLQHGYAVMGNDLGHTGGDLKFGEGHPEKVIDWAYRAMHVTAEAGKLIVRDSAGKWPEHAYFVGCSTGGHQALSEAQRYPDDYDGIVAGDPAYDRVHQTASYIWAWMAVHDQNGAPLFTPAKLQTVTKAAVAACDGIDGIKDGVIDDPRRCKFDPATLICTGAETDSCLTPLQADGVKKVYAGLKNPRTGEQIFPGFSPGSEGFGNGAGQGWMGFIVSPKTPMRSEVYKYLLFNDPNWDWHSFDFDKDVAYSDAKIGYMAAVDHDLSRFRNRGGKLIMYTGWADPVAAPEDIVKYYEGAVKAMGGLDKTQSFYRFFMAPGMGHCGGGYGPDTFDAVAALEQWVEHGTAPEKILASHSVDKTVQRTRPLCPYPQVARWTGKGSTDDAANFVCNAADGEKR